MKFNENLKFLRKQANLTQERLAEEINVSRQTITKWESGQSMPDIENLKELSYIFSVSIDSLVGDVESKSTLRIKKKIKDIGWFIVPFIFVYALLTMSISDFVISVSNNNEDLVIITVAFMIILGTVLLILGIKKWLTEKQNTIINLTDTIEGRRERRKFLLKKTCIMAIDLYIFAVMIDLPLIGEYGINGFIADLLKYPMRAFDLVALPILIILGYIVNYKKLTKQVKEFNTDSSKNEN